MCADSATDRSVSERFALLDQVRQSEIRATGFRVASVVGHLIGTPLNVIVGRASLIVNDPTGPNVEQNARKIEEQVGKLTQRIRRLIEYLNPPSSAAEPQSVGALLGDAISLYGPIAEQRRVDLRVCGSSVLNGASRPPSETGARASSETMSVLVEDGPTALVLLSSLLSLAMRAAPPNGVVEVNVRGQQSTQQGSGHLAARLVGFEMLIPQLPLPKGRIESMEPPEESDPLGAEHLRTLAVAASLARRLGGQLDVSSTETEALRVVFWCQRVHA